MRNVPGWVMGAAGVGVVAAAFFLGGRIAATERVPTTTAAEATVGVQLECEPGQRAVLRQTSLACVGAASMPAAFGQQYQTAPAAGYLQTVNRSPLPTMRSQSAPVQRTSAARAPVYRAPVKAKRSTQKSVAIIAGSAAAGAVVGGVAKGKKGAVVGGLIGGAAATIWDQVTRRKQ